MTEDGALRHVLFAPVLGIKRCKAGRNERLEIHFLLVVVWVFWRDFATGFHALVDAQFSFKAGKTWLPFRPRPFGFRLLRRALGGSFHRRRKAAKPNFETEAIFLLRVSIFLFSFPVLASSPAPVRCSHQKCSIIPLLFQIFITEPSGYFAISSISRVSSSAATAITSPPEVCASAP